MSTCLTSGESAVLSAQLAFIRDERRTQRARPRVFATRTGAPLPRQVALTALCDRVADQLLQLVQTDPAWALYEAEGADLPLAVAMAVAERVARYGQGVPECEVLEIASPVDECVTAGGLSDRLPDPFAMLMASVEPTGTVRWWPKAVPASVARDALAWEAAHA